jgi:ubiquinol-cytochrome c reductase cytochrome c1 subunit
MRRLRLAAQARNVARAALMRAEQGSLLPAVAAGSAVAVATFSTVLASDQMIHPPAQPWSHNGFFQAFDAASLRRGHQVYAQVCASCHGLARIAYRNLVNVCYSEAEVKAMAEDTDVKDGPNDEGEYFDRAGKLSDYLPSPYPNEEAARYANNGAYPPDLSLIVKARHGGADYIFALLTGYKDVPAGIAPRETQYYNPYFSGGWIGMPPPLADGAVDYDDETPATSSQMAKDISIFLAWTSEPEQDERKLMGIKVMTALAVMFGFTWYYKRIKWSPIKNRRLELY